MGLLIPLFSVFLVILNFASGKIPSTWNELLGSSFPIFPETGSSDILSSSNVNVNANAGGTDNEFQSRVLQALDDMLSDPQISKQIYSKYLAAYGKPASRNEIETFKKNVMFIAKQNLLYHTGKSTWGAGVTDSADMDSKEFAETHGLPSRF